jgi:hypothetical protein
MPSLIVFRSSVNTIIYPYTYPIRATDTFIDAATMASSYRLAGTTPLSTPLAKFLLLFRYLGRFLHRRPMTACHDACARMNQSNGKKYHITLSIIKFRGVALEMDLRECDRGKSSDCHASYGWASLAR